MKAFAIISNERAASNPEIGAIAEAVQGLDVKSISGLVVPAATPRYIVRKASADIGRVLAMADVKTRMAELGMQPAPTAPDAFDTFIRRGDTRRA